MSSADEFIMSLRKVNHIYGHNFLLFLKEVFKHGDIKKLNNIIKLNNKTTGDLSIYISRNKDDFGERAWGNFIDTWGEILYHYLNGTLESLSSEDFKSSS
jgi:hypothetical protein